METWGFQKYLSTRELSEPELPRENSMPSRALLTGGTLLVLLGFLHGAYYAGAMLYQHEQMETDILGRMIGAATQGDLTTVTSEVNNFGNLAGAHAVNIAAHSHIIEFGLLAFLLSFVQPFVFLSDKWKRRWVKLLLGGSVVLPVFVLLELNLGLVAGGIADLGGLAVIIGLVGMMVGIFRYTGSLDAAGRCGEAHDTLAEDSGFRRIGAGRIWHALWPLLRAFCGAPDFGSYGRIAGAGLRLSRRTQPGTIELGIGSVRQHKIRLRSPGGRALTLDWPRHDYGRTGSHF